MAVCFLDVNGIFEKRIIRTFGKCTRQLRLDTESEELEVLGVEGLGMKVGEPGEGVRKWGRVGR